MSLSVATILAESAERRPDHPAVVFGDDQVGYRDLWRSARQYAAVLRSQGLGEDDKVALLLPNTPHFPMVYFGVLAIGAVPVPIHTLLKTDEITYILRDVGAAALVCAAPLLAEGQPAAEATAVPLLTIMEAAAAADRVRLDTLADDIAPIDRHVARRPDDIALILYTSGTTGRPKGAVLTTLNIVMNVNTTMVSPFAMGPDDVLLGCLPLFHTFGQICGMLTCFNAGATLVLMSRFKARTAIDLMVQHGCTVFMGVPTMYIDLLNALPPSGRPRLDRAYSGGSALPVRVLEEFERSFGCPIYEGYGLTETSPVVAYNQMAWPCRPGTVGRPIWGVEVEIARPEPTDRIELLPPGELGEVVIRGHNVMAGYLNRPEATAEALVEGWFRSGDLGVKDDDGYLTLVDRKKDMVLRGGYNIYPREVEEVLMRHPAIEQVAVIGVADDRYGEEVCAVVSVRSEVEPNNALAMEIMAWAKVRLASYKYPRRIEFVTSFPLGPSGKILKRQLVNQFS